MAAASSSFWQGSPEHIVVHTSAAALQALLPDVQKTLPEACPATDMSSLAILLGRMINISGTVVPAEMTSLLTQAMGQRANQPLTPTDPAKPVHSQMHDIARRLRRSQQELEELEESKAKQREFWLVYLTVVRQRHSKQVSTVTTKMDSIEEAMQKAKVEETAALQAMAAIQNSIGSARALEAGGVSSDAKVAKIAATLQELLPDFSQDRKRSDSLLTAVFADA